MLHFFKRNNTSKSQEISNFITKLWVLHVLNSEHESYFHVDFHPRRKGNIEILIRNLHIIQQMHVYAKYPAQKFVCRKTDEVYVFSDVVLA